MAWGRRNEPVRTEPTGSSKAAVAPQAEIAVAKPDAKPDGVPAAKPDAMNVEPKESSLHSIGTSVQVKGELTGSEDVRIDGSFEGIIALPDHRLQVGRTGRVHADVDARAVVVEGEVVGNIHAEDRVEVAATGSVFGDICAARVVLADGARFKGSIDMGPQVVAPMQSVAATSMPADHVESALASVFDAKN